MKPSWRAAGANLTPTYVGKMTRALFIISAFAAAVVAEVTTLGDKSFDSYVENLSPEALLLVDFYKPGCKHCMRLSPVLDYLEAEWEKEEPDDSLRWFKVAKVDCEASPRVKSVFGIDKVPDLRFVRDGHWNTYEGSSTIEGIRDFKARMAVTPLPAVDEQGLLERLSTEDAVFVLAMEADADAVSVAKGVLVAASVRQHTAAFCSASEGVLSSLGLGSEALPALLKVVAAPEGQSGVLKAAFFDGDLSRASSWSVLQWVDKENYGLVSDFTAENFGRLGSMGKFLVMGIIDPKDEKTPPFKRAFGKVATGLGLKHQDNLIFGTLNGASLRGFVESLGIFEGLPRLVVLDMPQDLHYVVENLGLESADMEAFLIDVMSERVPAKGYTDGTMRYMMKIWWFIRQGGAWSLLLLFPLAGLVWIFLDTPEAEERRAEAREAKKLALKEQEEKDEQKATDNPMSD